MNTVGVTVPAETITSPWVEAGVPHYPRSSGRMPIEQRALPALVRQDKGTADG